MLYRLTRCGIHSALDVLASIEPLVQSRKHDPQHAGRNNGHGRHEAVVDESGLVLRIGLGRIQIAGVNGRRVGHCIDEAQRRGSLRRWPRQCIADPGQCCRVAAI